MIWILSAFGLVGFAGVGAALVRLERKLREAHRRLHTLTVSQQRADTLAGQTLRAVAEARAKALGRDAVARSQHGEEVALWERAGWRTDGVYVEIGAYDGRSLSNSAFFDDLGWTGLLIEPHPQLAAKCRVSRPRATVVEAALGARDGGTIRFAIAEGAPGIGTLSFVDDGSDQTAHIARIRRAGGTIRHVDVPVRTLASVLAEHAPGPIDWMSIDVEGFEERVLAGADFAVHRPGCLLIEDNDGTSPLAAAVRQLGYVPTGRVGCNDVYADAQRPAAANAKADDVRDAVADDARTGSVTP